MSDVLVYLHALVRRCVAMQMPTELHDVVAFLQGKNYCEATLPNNTNNTVQCVRAPFGLTAWHRFTPLAIAATSTAAATNNNSLLSAAEDSASVLYDYLLHNGFDRVVAVRLMKDEPQIQQQQQQSLSSGVSLMQKNRSALEKGSELPMHGKRGRNEADIKINSNSESVEGPCGVTVISGTASVQAAREACVDTVRHSCTCAERTRRHSRNTTTTTTTTSSTTSDTRAELRRVLVVIHCHTDNRHAISVQSSNSNSNTTTSSSVRRANAAGMHTQGTRATNNNTTTTTTATRHRYGNDILQLLLQDLASVMTLHEIRAEALGTAVRVQLAVLIVPEDYSYGGQILARRLRAELGMRYVVQLFPDEDERKTNEYTANGTKATRLHNTTEGTQESNNAWARTRRLLSLWQPAALSTLTVNNSSVNISNGVTSDKDEEEQQNRGRALSLYLLREPDCFFLRESNHLLAFFLCEALRRFPLLVQKDVLRSWCLAWTLRHSLTDVVLAFHDALMPFTLSKRMQTLTRNTRLDSAGHCETEVRRSCRQRNDAMSVYSDTVLIINALLETAAALGQHDEADRAVMFMLLYSELTKIATTASSSGSSAGQAQGRLLRAPCLVQSLATIYDRERYATLSSNKYAHRSTSIAISLHDGDGNDNDVEKSEVGTSAQEKAVIVLNKLLPFAGPYTINSTSEGENDDASCKEHVDMLSLRIPVTPALRHTALTALMPPAASLRELNALDTNQSSENSSAIEYEEVEGVMSDNNFYNPHIPHAIRVLYLLTTKAAYARREKDKWAALTELQAVCQLSDEALLLVLTELQRAGLAVTNLQQHTVRSLLDGV